MKLPRDTGPIHFVGIGGIGMSGIAEVLANLGYAVQGSDAADNYNVKRLKDKGIRTFIGHAAENLGEAGVVVVSTAIRRDNPELLAARERRLPVVRRAEMLAELMRLLACRWRWAGTHGKTTTTSHGRGACSTRGGIDPTVVNGGIINAYGANAQGSVAGEWIVVEADESDGTFLKLRSDGRHCYKYRPRAPRSLHGDLPIAIKDRLPGLRARTFPFYGFSPCSASIIPWSRIWPRSIENRRVWSPMAPTLRPRFALIQHRPWVGRRRPRFGMSIRDRQTGARPSIEFDLGLPMPGGHNALNATAAIAVAHNLGMEPDAIRKALAGFGGVKRRFTRTGAWNGVEIFDDYGHHPVEIAAVLKAARASTPGQVIAIVQPHRYSRLASLFNEFSSCFNDADVVVVADVYGAGEAPIEGADRDSLVAGIKARGHRHVVALDRPGALAGIVASVARPGDYVVLLGAGNITQWAYALPDDLAALG